MKWWVLWFVRIDAGACYGVAGVAMCTCDLAYPATVWLSATKPPDNLSAVCQKFADTNGCPTPLGVPGVWTFVWLPQGQNPVTDGLY